MKQDDIRALIERLRNGLDHEPRLAKDCLLCQAADALEATLAPVAGEDALIARLRKRARHLRECAAWPDEAVYYDEAAARIAAQAREIESWRILAEKSRARAEAAEADARHLRELLGIVFCGPLLYTDDGELQDNRTLPFIDFRRDSPSEIETKIRERQRLARIANAEERAKRDAMFDAALREERKHETR